MKRHWAEVAAERASWPLQGDVFAYNVMSISEPDLARIRELLHATFREIRTIAATSPPTDCLALLNLHLVGWNSAEPMPGRSAS